MKKKNTNRREFIKKSGLLAGSIMIVPSCVLGKNHVAPSDKLNIAAIGGGGKGSSDLRNAWNNGENNVVAICDIDANMAAGSMKAFPGAKYYKDFRVMLEEMKGQIDAVTISTPDHVHGIAAMTAMELGMHVYVQKPLTHNIYEARQLTLAANKYKRVTQMGNQGASNPGIEQMIKWYDSGMIGTVHTVYSWTNRPVWPQGVSAPTDQVAMPSHLSAADWDLFIGPAAMVDYHPLYHPFKWRGWWNFGTGALGDMGCHLMDPPYRVLGLGYPTEVECSVGQVFKRDWVPEYLPESCPPSSSVQLKFAATTKNPSPVTMTWSDGGIKPFHPDLIPADDYMGEPSSANGAMLIGSKGIMVCGTYGINPVMYLNNGEKVSMSENYLADNPLVSLPEFGHQALWAQACKAGFGSKEHRALTSSFDYAGPMTETVLMGNLAIRSYTLNTGTPEKMAFDGRKKLLWDGQNTRITNFEAANQFVTRPYRNGWKLI